MPATGTDSAEQKRLDDSREGRAQWKKWGPYLSERQWGTVREDYSKDGNAWDYFSHDQSRSRAYRWGEDGLGGICDDKQRLCFALTLWNGRDPILKERLFGLTNSEGNHGEDVKEYYYYLDSTPTHSYMKYLYKYPQHEYPYDELVATNKKRSRDDLEFELIDTGVFDEDRYFDVFVEYAKQSPEDILIVITAHNRGPEPATVHLLPTIWFRNTWSWGEDLRKPVLRSTDGGILASHPELGSCTLLCDTTVESTQRISSRQRCLSRISDCRPIGCREPCQNRHQSRGTLRASDPPGKERVSSSSLGRRTHWRSLWSWVQQGSDGTDRGCGRLLQPHYTQCSE